MQGITVDKVLTLAGLNAASLFLGQPPRKGSMWTPWQRWSSRTTNTISSAGIALA